MAPLSTTTVLFAFIAIGPRYYTRFFLLFVVLTSARFSTTRSRVSSGGHRCAECASGHGYWLEVCSLLHRLLRAPYSFHQVPFALDMHLSKDCFRLPRVFEKWFNLGMSSLSLLWASSYVLASVVVRGRYEVCSAAP